jgi:hypothetical protein
MAEKINDSIFKQYLGSLEDFKDYYEGLESGDKAKLNSCLVFIHDDFVVDEGGKPIVDEDGNNVWNNDGYIFTNGYYYTCRETNLTASTILQLIEQGNTSGMLVEEVNGKLVFTPVIKEELKPLINVGFVKAGDPSWAAGTPIEEILNDIFAKEIWYSATPSTISYSNVISASIPAPSLNVTVGDVAITDSTVTCEIGAPITLSGTLQDSTVTYKQNFTVTCNSKGSDGSDNHGFALHGATGYPTSTTSSVVTSASIPVTESSTGSDVLSLTTFTGGFQSAIIDDNQLKFATDAESSTTQYVQAGANKIEILSTSKTYTATANPGDTQKYLYTISNKGNYPTADTMDGVDVKQAISKTETATPTATSSITITGAYRYYYVWGVAEQPTIEDGGFSGVLTGWDSKNWASTTLQTAEKSLNGYIYVLKPATDSATPTIQNSMGQTGEFALVDTLTNKYKQGYKLYRFPAGTGSQGTSYKNLKL